MITLLIDGEELELTRDAYKESLKSVEETHVTEAGTTIRSITRSGIYGLSVSYTGTETEKKILDGAVNRDYVTVSVFDEIMGTETTHRMYVDPSSYSASLVVEDDSHRYYKLSFTLKDLE